LVFDAPMVQAIAVSF